LDIKGPASPPFRKIIVREIREHTHTLLPSLAQLSTCLQSGLSHCKASLRDITLQKIEDSPSVTATVYPSLDPVFKEKI
jgi:hypothetical protein